MKNANVPLVGQPFQYKSWFPTVMITCGCDAASPLLILGNAVAQCPSCQRRFAIRRIAWDRVTGKLDIEIGLVADAPGQSQSLVF